MNSRFSVYAIFLLFSFTATESHGTIVVTATETAQGVVFTGSGEADLTGLTPNMDYDSFPAVIASFAEGLVIGPTSVTPVDAYSGMQIGPSFFDGMPPPSQTLATMGNGDVLGIDGALGILFLPSGYQSGDPLASESLFAGETLASLRIAPGTYVYSWGSGPTADTLTLNAIPEPSTALLIGTGLVLLRLHSRRPSN